MTNIEKNIFKFIEKHLFLISLILIIILSLFIRFMLIDFKSQDYLHFLSNWYDYFKNNGGLKALKSYPGDYNAPYMTLFAIISYINLPKLYLIKSISFIGDFLLAFASYKIANKITKNNKIKSLLIFAIILNLPVVLMNSAMWGQCDSIYSSFILFGIYELMNEKYLKSFIFFGIAFAFKLQLMLIIPALLIYYVITKKFSLLNFLLLPTVNLILCIPSIIFGKSIVEVFTIYFNQTNSYNYMSLNFPNIYNFIPINNKYFAIVLTAIAFFILLVYLINKKTKFNNEKILLLFIISELISTLLLPGMHERYMYPGEILSILYFLIYKENIIYTLLILISSPITYSRFIFEYRYIDLTYLSIVYSIIVSIFIFNSLMKVTDNKDYCAKEIKGI